MVRDCNSKSDKEVPGAAAINDVALMAAIAAREDRALATFYDRYSGVVFAICLRALSRTAAEDVVIDVFWELWERAERYDPMRGSPIVYLMGVVRSRIRDKLRAGLAGKRQLESPVPGDGIADGSSPGPLDNALLAEERSRVVAALAQLPPDQRRLVELSFFGALSHSEIADQLGEPLGTIKSRIRQGLIRMRDLLTDNGGI